MHHEGSDSIFAKTKKLGGKRMDMQFRGVGDKSNRPYEVKLEHERRITNFEQNQRQYNLPTRVIDTGLKTKEGEALVVGYYEQERILTDLSQVNRIFKENGFLIEYDVIDTYDYVGVTQVFPSAKLSIMYLDAYAKQEEARMAEIQLAEDLQLQEWNGFLDAHTGRGWKPDTNLHVQLVLVTSEEDLETDTAKIGELMQGVINALRAYASGEKEALKNLNKRYSNKRWGLEDIDTMLERLKKSNKSEMKKEMTREESEAFLQQINLMTERKDITGRPLREKK